MKRAGMLLCVAALAAALACPPAALAVGDGWKDLLIGMGLGTALGTAIGGATVTFVSPQYQADKVFPLHYIYGASIGLVVGTVGGGTSFYAWGCEVDLSYQHIFQNNFRIKPPSNLNGGGLGDGRGFYKSSFDMASIAFNWNFGDFYRAMKGQPPKWRKKGGLL